MVVVRAMIWVMKVAKARCHVVRMIAREKSLRTLFKCRIGRIYQCVTYGNLCRRNVLVSNVFILSSLKVVKLLTEVGSIKDPFVEEDNTGTQGNPGTVYHAPR
jgi:hypothetical protein